MSLVMDIYQNRIGKLMGWILVGGGTIWTTYYNMKLLGNVIKGTEKMSNCTNKYYNGWLIALFCLVNNVHKFLGLKMSIERGLTFAYFLSNIVTILAFILFLRRINPFIYSLCTTFYLSKMINLNRLP